jgi:hypothetical protein
VYDAVPVRVVEPLRRLARDAHRLGHGELALPSQPVAQALALDVRHREPEPARGLAGVEHREHVRVLEPASGRDLAPEALRAERGAEVDVEHLERDRPVVLAVVREVHGGHPAAPELALEQVVIGQCRP